MVGTSYAIRLPVNYIANNWEPFWGSHDIYWRGHVASFSIIGVVILLYYTALR
jgi:hypothetical protein